ncbi:MAG: NUDIX hydrolase [Patescibacteria group bacterium]
MPHINPNGIDFTVVVFIVYKDKVLLIHHLKENKWLAPGGHIETNETPDEAALREIKEETGLDIRITSQLPTIDSINGDNTILHTPEFVSIHNINSCPGHRHLALIYFAKSFTDKITLASAEHSQIKWFNSEELTNPAWYIPSDIIWFAKQALKQGL